MSRKGRGSRHVAAYSDCPHGQLIPWQEIAGKTQKQGEHEQDHADVPVELSWRLVGTGHKDAEHVKPHSDHHRVSTPAMDFTHDAERHLFAQVDDIDVGVVECRAVVE